MADEKNSPKNRRPTGLSGSGQVTASLVGVASGLLTLAAGIGTNALSEQDPYRRAGALFVVAAVISATAWLRRLPADAPLVRHSTPALLGAALLVAMASLVTPVPWAGYLVGAATLATLASALILAELKRAALLLLGSAGIGSGVAYTAFGVNTLRNSDVQGGLLLLAFGAALLGFGASALRRGEALRRKALVGLAVVFIGVGVSALSDGEVTNGLLAVAAGAAFISGKPGEYPARNRASGWTLFCFGAGAIVGGVLAIRDGQVTNGRAMIAAGVALVAFGVSIVYDGGVRTGAAAIVAGVAIIGVGVVGMHGSAGVLPGTAVIVGGLAGICLGIWALNESGVWARARARWLRLTGSSPEPGEPEPPTTR